MQVLCTFLWSMKRLCSLSNSLSPQTQMRFASFGKLIDFRIIEQHLSDKCRERLSVKMIFILISSTDSIMWLHCNRIRLVYIQFNPIWILSRSCYWLTFLKMKKNHSKMSLVIANSFAFHTNLQTFSCNSDLVRHIS